MPEQGSPPVPPDPENLTDAAGTSSRPTKTRPWSIDTSSPMSEEDAAQHDKEFVERHLTILKSLVVIAMVYSTFAVIFVLLSTKPNTNKDEARAVILLFTSDVLCLLVVILTLVAKWFLSSYLVHQGESWTERSADRQRKLDAFEKWRFDLFLKSPAATLLIASPLLICGVYLWLWHRHPSLPYILVTLAVPLGFLYIAAVAALVLS